MSRNAHKKFGIPNLFVPLIETTKVNYVILNKRFGLVDIHACSNKPSWIVLLVKVHTIPRGVCMHKSTNICTYRTLITHHTGKAALSINRVNGNTQANLRPQEHAPHRQAQNEQVK